MTKTNKKLAYSPIGMDLGKDVGWGTLLFTCSRACNLNCKGCWTAATNGFIKEELKVGAKWLYDGSYGINVMESILSRFKEKGGKLIACMSDGEPLVESNYEFILELAKNCGRIGLPFLLFTNGINLTQEKIGELKDATKGGISFCISMQAGDRERYSIVHGKDTFEKLKTNFPAWQDYNRKILKETGMHGIAVHTYIIPGETTEEDMEAIKRVIERLGNVHWVVSTMGVHVSESLRGRINGKTEDTLKLIDKYSTGPTATVAFGKNENEKICSYIAHGFYPFTVQLKGVFGMTFNPYHKGAVQTCPYHSILNTSKWFSLKDYLDKLQKGKVDITDQHIGKWLEYALEIETLITKAIFDLVGYEHCLMRHSRKPEIDLFIARLNVEMTKYTQKERLDDNGYFEKIKERLKKVLGR